MWRAERLTQGVIGTAAAKLTQPDTRTDGKLRACMHPDNAAQKAWQRFWVRKVDHFNLGKVGHREKVGQNYFGCNCLHLEKSTLTRQKDVARWSN